MTGLHHGYAGRILYRDLDGRDWGRETFTATLHHHGRTLRAICEMDKARLHRDVNWSVDRDWRPKDGFVRVMREGVTIGTVWYGIDENTAECEGITSEHGRVSRQVAATRPILFLGTHPLVGDSSIAAARGRNDPGRAMPIMSAVNSLAPLGDQGLDLVLLEPLVTYVGSERLTVAAGTFEAERYSIRWSDQVPAVTTFWVSGPDYLPLLSVTDHGRYELVEFTRF
jgi:hypothetical protein